LKNCKEIEDSRSIWVEVSCGNYKTLPAYAIVTNEKDFYWKPSRIDKVDFSYPKDIY
jgi:hypothetical protein